MCQKARSNALGLRLLSVKWALPYHPGSKPTSWCLVSVSSLKVMSVYVNLLKSWPFFHMFSPG